MRSYKHDIVLWTEGTAQLSAEEYRVYHAVVQLIYLSEGPAAFNERDLAARCNMVTVTLRKAMASLIKREKVWLRDGRLYSARALVDVRKMIPDCPAWDLTPCTDAAPSAPRAKKPPAEIKPEVMAAFESFWNARAPRKGGDPRATAIRYFARIVASGIAPEVITARMERHKAALRSVNRLGTEFVPHTATWLNAEDFTTEDMIARDNVIELDPKKFSTDDWARVVRMYRITNDWKSALYGPEPGRPGCLCPAELLKASA